MLFKVKTDYKNVNNLFVINNINIKSSVNNISIYFCDI